jgi:hypothetical protein
MLHEKDNTCNDVLYQPNLVCLLVCNIIGLMFIVPQKFTHDHELVTPLFEPKTTPSEFFKIPPFFLA